MTDTGDVSRVLGMNVARDREEGTITINQKDYTEDIVQRYGMRGCNPAYTPGVGPELSLDQPEENLLNEEGKRLYQSMMVRLCTLLTTSSTSSTSWRGQCLSHLGHTWGRPSCYYVTWPGPPIYRSPTGKEVSSLRPFPTLTGKQTSTTGIPHHHVSNAFQRPDQLQGGHSRINCAIYNEDGIGGGGAHHEGSSLLQQYDAGARLQGGVGSMPLYIENTSVLHVAGNR